MSLDSILTALETLLEGVTGFTSATVSQMDYSIFNRGITKGMVLRPLDQRRELAAFGGPYDSTYLFAVELFERYADNDAAVNTVLDTDAQLVLNRLDAYPNLNAASGVLDAKCSLVTQMTMPPPELLTQPALWRTRTMIVEVLAVESTVFTQPG